MEWKTMTSPQNPVQLYRHLLRIVKKLPKESQDYYKNYVRQVKTASHNK